MKAWLELWPPYYLDSIWLIPGIYVNDVLFKWMANRFAELRHQEEMAISRWVRGGCTAEAWEVSFD